MSAPCRCVYPDKCFCPPEARGNTVDAAFDQVAYARSEAERIVRAEGMLALQARHVKTLLAALAAAEAREEKAIQVIEDLLGNVPPFHSWPQEKEAWEKAQDDAQAFVDAQKKKKSPFREPKMEKIDKGIDWIGRVQEDEE